MKKCAVVALSFLSGLFLTVGLTHAHGVIGKRFIPKSAVKIYDIEEAKKKESGSECLG